MIDAIGEETTEDSNNHTHSRQKKLTNEEVAQVSLDFLVGGHETLASTLSFAVYLLTTNPDVQEKLQKEIDIYYHDNPVRLI